LDRHAPLTRLEILCSSSFWRFVAVGETSAAASRGVRGPVLLRFDALFLRRADEAPVIPRVLILIGRAELRHRQGRMESSQDACRLPCTKTVDNA
jgi:hypothetical protein